MEKSDSKEEIKRQRTMRKVEQKMKKTIAFAVFEGIPQNFISGSADEWQIEQLSGR